jgi:proteasome accessory factor C
VDLEAPPNLAQLRDAAGKGLQVEIDYVSSSTDEMTTRVVDPTRVHSEAGRWYLDGWCHKADGERRFRVDRVLDVRLTGEQACHRSTSTDGPMPVADAAVVRIAVDEAGAWLLDAVPVMRTEVEPGGRTVVTLAVWGHAWFERLLLQLGRHAEVLEPPELVGAGAEAARRVLALYEERPGAPAPNSSE